MLIKEYSNGCKAVLATEQHAEDLAPFLRYHDRLEVGAYGFDNCEEAMVEAVKNDKLTITALDSDGVPFAMFGVGVAEATPYIWLLGSEGVKDNWYTFAKASKELLPHLLLDFPCVTNLVLKDYTASVRWLKWLGARFIRELEISGQTFYEFVITANQPDITNITQSKVEDFKVKVTEFENNLKTLDGALVDPDEIEKINPLEHAFGDGMYVRKIVMPSGQLIVSKIHKQNHPYFIMSGDVSVLTEEGVKRIKAPYHGMTKVGTKRILYTHEETTWITVQQTHETDLTKIEEETMARCFEDPSLTEKQMSLLIGGKEITE